MLRCGNATFMHSRPRHPYLFAQVSRIDATARKRFDRQRHAQAAFVFALDDADLSLTGQANPLTKFDEGQAQFSAEAFYA